MIFQDNFGSGWNDWSYQAKIKIIPSDTAVNSPAALQVSLDGWGGLSLHHNGILTTPYYYIDFEIYAGPVALPLTASFRDAATDTDKAPGISIFQARYLKADSFLPNKWQLVRLPLIELGAADLLIGRFTLYNNSDHQDDFLVRRIRLAGAISASHNQLL